MPGPKVAGVALVARASGLKDVGLNQRLRHCLCPIVFHPSDDAYERFALDVITRWSRFTLKSVRQFRPVEKFRIGTDMNTVTFGVTPGSGEKLHKALGYSSAVRVGDRVETSGQAGVDDDLVVPELLADEIVLAFDNVESTLATVGATGCAAPGWTPS